MPRSPAKHKIDIDLNELPDGVRQYIKRSLKRCTKNKVSVHLTNKKFVLAEGLRCGGYFDSHCVSGKPKELVCSNMRTQVGWSTYLHEESHMDQCLDGDGGFFDPSYFRNYDSKSMEEMTPSQLRNHLNRYRDIEEDCERRTVRKLFANPELLDRIDYKLYVQRANMYIWSYNVMKDTGCWFPNSTKALWSKGVSSLAPALFLDDYSETPSQYYDTIIRTGFPDHLHLLHNPTNEEKISLRKK